jgi:WD40 repeat protein
VYEEEVVDLSWNPGENIIISLHLDGVMCLYSIDTLSLVMKFEKQSIGISSIAWMDNISGDIVTSSSKVGALKVWNAANEAPKDMIKIGPHGITSMLSIKN